MEENPLQADEILHPFQKMVMVKDIERRADVADTKSFNFLDFIILFF